MISGVVYSTVLVLSRASIFFRTRGTPLYSLPPFFFLTRPGIFELPSLVNILTLTRTIFVLAFYERVSSAAGSLSLCVQQFYALCAPRVAVLHGSLSLFLSFLLLLLATVVTVISVVRERERKKRGSAFRYFVFYSMVLKKRSRSVRSKNVHKNCDMNLEKSTRCTCHPYTSEK